MSTDTVEYYAVPQPHEEARCQEILRMIGDPNLAINLLPDTPEMVEQAKKVLQGLSDANGVNVFEEKGDLYYGPVERVTLQQVALLIAFRLPILAALREGFEPVDPPNLDDLEAMLGNGPGGFPEHMLQDLGMRQGQEWGYIMDDGKMEAGINLDGLLLMVDRCATEQGWPDKERDELKQEFRANWAREHGGGGHG